MMLRAMNYILMLYYQNENEGYAFLEDFRISDIICSLSLHVYCNIT